MTSFVEWIMFDTEFFFLVLLPPVIFESGYTLNPETLFKNFDAISVFAFLGTFTSTLVVGAIMYFSGHLGFSYPFTLRDAMLFASLISSTDPVTTLAIFSDMGLDAERDGKSAGTRSLGLPRALADSRPTLRIPPPFG